MQKRIFLLLAATACLLLMTQQGFSLVIPGSDVIEGPSIRGDVTGSVNVDTARGFGMRMLSLAKMIISGFALIYIVLIGANLILFSESEEAVSKQKRQMIYAMMGFLFLNIPTVMYDIFGPGT